MKLRLSTILESELEGRRHVIGVDQEALVSVVGRNEETGHAMIIESASLISNSVRSLNLSTGKIYSTTLEILNKLIYVDSGGLTPMEEARIEPEYY